MLLAPAEWPDGTLWFPDRLSAAFLAGRRKDLSPYLYSCNYQQDPVSATDRKFRDDWWRTYAQLPDEVDWYLTLDPAGDGTTKTTSHTAIVVVAVPPTEQPWYVVRAERWWSTDADLVRSVFDWHAETPFRAIGVEMVQLRGLIRTAFAQEGVRRRVPIDHLLVELEPHGVPKVRRIESLGALWATGQILVAPEGMDALEEEFTRFPKGRFKDLLDALAYMGQLIGAPWAPATDAEQRAAREDAEWLAPSPRRMTTKGQVTGY